MLDRVPDHEDDDDDQLRDFCELKIKDQQDRYSA